MAKNIKIILTAAVAAVIAVTLAASIFVYLAFIGDFDHKLFYFNKGSVNAVLGTVLPFIGALIAVVTGFILRKKASFTDSPSANLPTIFASIVTGILVIASAFVPGGVASGLTTVKPAVFMILSVLAGGYFIALPFIRPCIETPKGSFMTSLSFAPALFAAMMLLEEYFRLGEALNSPIRIANLTMYSLLLLYFAEDIRFAIGKASPALYYLISLSALSFTGAASIPKLIVILGGAEGFSFNFMEWCVGAAMFMFVLARLSALPTILGEYKEERKPDTKKKKISDTTSSDNTEI